MSRMLETVTFPVARCERCGIDAVVARALGDDDEWVLLCTRCSHPLAADALKIREYASSTLKLMGYDVEGEGPGGCGTGGSCGSCGA